MKIYSLASLGILMMLALFIACQQTVNPELEKEAILAVLEEEGRAYAAKDKDGLYNLFIQDPMSTRLDYIFRNYQLMEGFEEIKSLYDQYWENWTDEGNPRNLKENAIIRVSGKNAWVLCDNVWEWDTPSGTMRNTNIQTTFLEKTGDAWKITFMSFVAKPPDEQTLSEIEKLRNDLIAALNENDLERILATATEESVCLVPNDRAYQGMNELRQFQEARIAQLAVYEGKSDFKIVETRMFPGIAYDRFQLNMDLTSKKDQSRLSVYNQGYWIYHQQNDGSWKVAQAIWSDYKP